MYKLTYSNTFKGPLDTDPEQTTTGNVLVETPVDATALIRQWNINSRDHCTGRYHYRQVSLEPATKKDIETLDLY